MNSKINENLVGKCNFGIHTFDLDLLGHVSIFKRKSALFTCECVQ